MITAPQKEKEISNIENDAFYESITPSEMAFFGEKGGISNFCDIEEIYPHIKESGLILEVGAGYGRVIDGLVKSGFVGNITAIEKSKSLFDFLKKKYHGNSKIDLLKLDIMSLSTLHKKFDAILFLWSGIQDFAPEEQKTVIRKLKNLLNENGKLIIDNIPASVKPLGAEKHKGYGTHQLVFKDSKVYIHDIPTNKINAYSDHAGFKHIKHFSYLTETKRKRVFHILYS